ISEKNAPLTKIFKSIEKQTGFVFWYESNLLKQAENIDLQVKDQELNDVLEKIFYIQPLTYSIVNKTIVVQKKSNWENKFIPPPVEVNGIVIDSHSGQPIT